MAYLFIRMGNSPRPGLWSLEKSSDYGKTWTPWQHFSDSPTDCVTYFGPDSLKPLQNDDDVICTMDHSKIVPLEGGEVGDDRTIDRGIDAVFMTVIHVCVTPQDPDSFAKQSSIGEQLLQLVHAARMEQSYERAHPSVAYEELARTSYVRSAPGPNRYETCKLNRTMCGPKSPKSCFNT